MDRRAFFRFYAELNDLLAPSKGFTDFEHDFELSPSVKDVIESLGVPHTEVDMILVNGAAVDFAYRLKDGDRVAVFPVFESLDISGIGVRPEPLRRTKFVADANLGKLARLLRLLGFDTTYDPAVDDPVLADQSRSQKRVLLTRDRGVLKRSIVTHGYFVRSDDPEEQAAEVLVRFDLVRSVDPLTRCLECNGSLEDATFADVADRLPESTRSVERAFRTCPRCRRVYWRGAHYPRLAATVDRIVDRSEARRDSP